MQSSNPEHFGGILGLRGSTDRRDSAQESRADHTGATSTAAALRVRGGGGEASLLLPLLSLLDMLLLAFVFCDPGVLKILRRL